MGGGLLHILMHSGHVVALMVKFLTIICNLGKGLVIGQVPLSIRPMTLFLINSVVLQV